MAEERLSESEDQQKLSNLKNREKKMEAQLNRALKNIKHTKTLVMGLPKGEERKKKKKYLKK